MAQGFSPELDEFRLHSPTPEKLSATLVTSAACLCTCPVSLMCSPNEQLAAASVAASLPGALTRHLRRLLVLLDLSTVLGLVLLLIELL
eukprot:CAMPEP_0175096042 /NCGR_PEP_ID=MMETSP0086_2-20121207/4507_1 /TAXON_ID=136419 /ORGANISM="Unknown Unknown, Strain D1" /LENGTH=88 /DNA_ID=CAMNT_0016369389 /DNA_START=233 /DNA_END=495 /DNA_ORIENTATION=+